MGNILASQMKEYFNADIIYIIDQPLTGKTTYLNYLRSVFEEFDNGDENEEEYILVDDFENFKHDRIFKNIRISENLVIAVPSKGNRIMSGNCKVLFFHSLEQAKSEIDKFIFFFKNVRVERERIIAEVNALECKSCKRRI